MKKSSGLKSSFEQKQKFREELKSIKSLSRELINQRNTVKEARKLKRKENLQRRKGNELKSEVLQVVSSTHSNKKKNNYKSFCFTYLSKMHILSM